MKNSIFFILLVTLFSTAAAYCQSSDPESGGTHDFELTYELMQPIKYYKLGTATPEHLNVGEGNKIGTYQRTENGQTVKETWRTVYKIKVNIPVAAVSVSDVRFDYVTNNTENYRFKVGTLGGFFTGPEGYGAILTMPVLFEGALYGTRAVYSTSLGEKLILNKQQYIYIGVMSENESAANSSSNLTFTIKGQYTIPLSIAKLTVKNNDPNGGIIKVGIDEEPQIVTSPYVNDNFMEHSVANMEAVDQQINGEYKGWDGTCRWGKSIGNTPAGTIPGRKQSYPSKRSEPDVTFTANLIPANCVSVQYNNPGKGIVTVTKEGVAKTVAAGGESFIVAGQNTLTLTAIYNTVENINYSFQGWKNDATGLIESTNPVYTIDPEENRSYTAIFQGTANTSMMNVQSNCSQAGQRPVITWTDNPNDAVSYKIYMMMVPNGNTTGNYSPTHIANVAKGVQYYQHPTFEINNNPGMDDLFLEVKAYYSTENTLVSAGWAQYKFDGLFPEEPGDPASKKNTGIQKDQVVTKYALANYPNPFNPTTVINYQVPEAGHVTVKVYDVMGKEIATLVDGAKNKGSYNISFSMDQYHLSSGIYFCRMQSGKNITTTKMILSK